LKKVNFSGFNAILVIVLLVILAFGLYSTTSIKNAFTAAEPKVSKLEVITLSGECDGCMTAADMIKIIEGLPNIKIESQKDLTFNEAETKELITKYAIKKLPAIILKGAETMEGFEKVEDALVFRNVPAPYVNAETGNAVGLVTATFIEDTACKECADITNLVEQLKQLGISIVKEQHFAIGTEQGKTLVDNYKIDTVPTLTLSADVKEYPVIQQVWSQIGTIESDGTYVLRMMTAPYKELNTSKVRGFVDLTFLVDKSCKTCYNVSLHKNILQGNFGMKLASEKFLDVSSTEGKKLAKNYGITLIPTVLMSSEAGVYPIMSKVWSEVGTVEEDGTYVFRAIDKLGAGTYKDLSTGTEKNATA